MKKEHKLLLAGALLELFISILNLNCVKEQINFEPGKRFLLDAHNCYPDNGRWADRIDRALNCGLPIAIEQDLVWYTDSVRGKSWSIVAHGEPYSGNEPTLRDYFFERIRPIVEKALQRGDKTNWPLLTLNLDFKTNVPEHYSAIWKLLMEYQDWLCNAERVLDSKRVMPLELKPVLILTGKQDKQEVAFHDSIKIGEKLLLFGAIQTFGDSVEVPPEIMAPYGKTNYRRWWNNPWSVVERDRYNNNWSKIEKSRLRSLVSHAHKLGLWIRFYTLNGYEKKDGIGWSESYNFGSMSRVTERWQTAIDCSVDFIATDQYETFAAFLKQNKK